MKNLGLLTSYNENQIRPERRHKARNIESIVQSWRKRARLDQDPIRAVGLFAAKNPDKIYM